MGSKYQEFTQEAAFQAEPGVVREAVRAFTGNWLAGWSLSETPDGIEATGQIGGCQARAAFRIEPAAGGANLVVALQVEHIHSQDSERGDIVEDYDDLARKWLAAIPWWIEQKQTAAPLPAGGQGKTLRSGLPKRRWPRFGDIVGGCFLISWIFVITIFALAALIGLVTGELKLPSKRSGDLVTTYGWGARIVSTFILAFYGWIVYSIWKWRKMHKGKPWI